MKVHAKEKAKEYKNDFYPGIYEQVEDGQIEKWYHPGAKKPEKRGE